MMHGFVRPDFADVAVALRQTLAHKRGGGGAAAVYFRGEKVVDIWAGTRDSDGRKWEQDTTAMSWSTSKGVIATAAHRLADRGLLDVNAPVGEYWPEFKAAGKEDIRVVNLLDHSAGMHRVRGIIDDAEMLLDWERTTAALAAAAPAYAAGTMHGYHAITYGFLVGEVLRRITGLTVDEVVQREIVQPLELTGMSIGARGAAFEHVATLITSWPDPDKTERAVRRLDRVRRFQMPIDAFLLDGLPEIVEAGTIYDADIPAINGCFTARSLARMYSVLATGEQIAGASFLSPSTLRRATAVRTTARDAKGDALAARLPHGGDQPRRLGQRFRPLRPRRVRGVGRPVPGTGRRHGVQPHGGHSVRRPAPPQGRWRGGQMRATRVGRPHPLGATTSPAAGRSW
jgi:CubicO group peptidase (beta-lactamase class C family)